MTKGLVKVMNNPYKTLQPSLKLERIIFPLSSYELPCMQQLPHRLFKRLTSSSRRSTSGFLGVFGRVFSTVGRTCFTSSQS